jgi:peptidoglycan pentaglycine glycine transferase (the first glycine)
MISVESCEEKSTWDDYILDNGGHPLQLWGWGKTKAAHGWFVDRVFVTDEDDIIGAAQLLIKQLPGGIKTLVYIPRGPVTLKKNREVVLNALADYAKHTYKALALTIEPHWKNFDAPKGWRASTNTILLARTLILDLTKSEDDLQAVMSKKTRQYIRKSSSEDLVIKRVKTKEELDQCLEIYHETAERAGFALHDDEYYRNIVDNMADESPIFAAFHGENIVAFLWLAVSEKVAFELYGGVNEQGQTLRANYALKWHTIQTMKKWGVEQYDMNGLLNDGVSTFKQGFADHEDKLVGTYDIPLSILYVLWDKLLPFAKKLVRTLKNR